MTIKTLCPEGRPQREAPFLEFGGRLSDGTLWHACPCGFVHYRPPRLRLDPKPRPWWNWKRWTR